MKLSHNRLPNVYLYAYSKNHVTMTGPFCIMGNHSAANGLPQGYLKWRRQSILLEARFCLHLSRMQGARSAPIQIHYPCVGGVEIE
jgi:hypothetical protein